jgi:hypothetical protein
MEKKSKKDLVEKLIHALEDYPDSKTKFECATYVAIICAINAEIKDPHKVLDAVLSMWVKVNSALTKTYLGPSGEA